MSAVSLILSLPWFFPLYPRLSLSVSFFLWLLYCYQHQVRNVPVIDAHQCTASDRSRQHEKRSCWNKYICNEEKGGRQMACQFVFVKGWAGVALTYRSIMELLLLMSFRGVYTRHDTSPPAQSLWRGTKLARCPVFFIIENGFVQRRLQVTPAVFMGEIACHFCHWLFKGKRYKLELPSWAFQQQFL